MNAFGLGHRAIGSMKLIPTVADVVPDPTVNALEANSQVVVCRGAGSRHTWRA
jgi:hypothetical protein